MSKKKNLFILHTQYNIILSLAVIDRYYNTFQNDLILYSEFKVTEDYLNNLKKIFDNILIVRDNFEEIESNPIKREWILLKKYCKYRKSKFSKTSYDNVFLTQERPFDTLVLGDQKLSRDITVFNIEEDCYYSVNFNLQKYYNLKPQTKTDKFRRILYGRRYICERIYFYGQSSFYEYYYLTYPNNVRHELLQCNLIEICKFEIIAAVNRIYNYCNLDIPSGTKYLLLLFDLINRYNNPKKISEQFYNIVIDAISKGYTILCKYHPRETNKLHIISDQIYELPQIIPAEKVLTDLLAKDVLVIGNATTSILMANKLGFRTVSIAILDNNPNWELIGVLHEMGIETPASVSAILNGE